MADAGQHLPPIEAAEVLRVVILGAIVMVAALTFASGRVGTSYPVSGIILGVLVLAYSFLTSNTIIGPSAPSASAARGCSSPK